MEKYRFPDKYERRRHGLAWRLRGILEHPLGFLLPLFLSKDESSDHQKDALSRFHLPGHIFPSDSWFLGVFLFHVLVLLGKLRNVCGFFHIRGFFWHGTCSRLGHTRRFKSVAYILRTSFIVLLQNAPKIIHLSMTF